MSSIENQLRLEVGLFVKLLYYIKIIQSRSKANHRIPGAVVLEQVPQVAYFLLARLVQGH